MMEGASASAASIVSAVAATTGLARIASNKVGALKCARRERNIAKAFDQAPVEGAVAMSAQAGRPRLQVRSEGCRGSGGRWRRRRETPPDSDFARSCQDDCRN